MSFLLLLKILLPLCGYFGLLYYLIQHDVKFRREDKISREQIMKEQREKEGTRWWVK